MRVRERDRQTDRQTERERERERPSFNELLQRPEIEGLLSCTTRLICLVKTVVKTVVR